MTLTIIDDEAAEVTVRDAAGEQRFPLDSAEGFAAVSRAWLRAGWDAKHVYSFTWMGRPIIQLPEDMLRIQEVIFTVKPDVLIETGVAHGGSLVFYASLFKAMEKGRVIGIDVEIRPHNRTAIEAHPLSDRIALIEGSSTDAAVVEQVRNLVGPEETVLVVLDSNHTREHVLGELKAYGPIVSIGSYIVASDGVMEQIAGGPRAADDWSWNNPRQAALQFAREDTRFELHEPEWLFNEGAVRDRVTYWPDAFLRRVG
jgi:cephalosporin hydroxylase